MHRRARNYAPRLIAAACSLAALAAHAAPPADDLILRIEHIEWRGPDESKANASKPVDRADAASCTLLRCIEVQVVDGQFASKSMVNDERIELSGNLKQLPNELYQVKLKFAAGSANGSTSTVTTASFKRGEACGLGGAKTRRDFVNGLFVLAEYIDEEIYVSLRRAGESPPEAPSTGRRYLEQRAIERLADLGAEVLDHGPEYTQRVAFGPGWTGKKSDLEHLKRLTRLQAVDVQSKSFTDDDTAFLKKLLPDVEIRSLESFPYSATSTFPLSLTTYNEPAPTAPTPPAR